MARLLTSLTVHSQSRIDGTFLIQVDDTGWARIEEIQTDWTAARNTYTEAVLVDSEEWSAGKLFVKIRISRSFETL